MDFQSALLFLHMGFVVGVFWSFFRKEPNWSRASFHALALVLGSLLALFVAAVLLCKLRHICGLDCGWHAFQSAFSIVTAILGPVIIFVGTVPARLNLSPNIRRNFLWASGILLSLLPVLTLGFLLANISPMFAVFGDDLPFLLQALLAHYPWLGLLPLLTILASLGARSDRGASVFRTGAAASLVVLIVSMGTIYSAIFGLGCGCCSL